MKYEQKLGTSKVHDSQVPDGFPSWYEETNGFPPKVSFFALMSLHLVMYDRNLKQNYISPETACTHNAFSISGYSFFAPLYTPPPSSMQALEALDPLLPLRMQASH